MALTATEQRLHRVTELERKSLALMREGVGIETALSRTLADVMAQVVADRLKLADEFIDMADALMRSRHNLARAAIARYYYAMYHAMRAAAYQHHSGDDFEAHSVLSAKGVPPDYPSNNVASNELKDARLRRNEADYDQYPTDPKYFSGRARELRPIAVQFVSTARMYITSKGNPYT